ncbi:hypothetical protein [Pararhizobium arenae]|uniref:hypothetical protein n=1 Tax=Pararhizobium arenae TaxID=1856850 RepID=UPI00094B5698|nr:hypothetical protein [Pararhizobium arenae]
MFQVIEGGRRGSLPPKEVPADTSQIVAEGRRRLSEAGVDRYEARERLTGMSMPAPVRHLRMQIEFAVQALSQLSPTPQDITADHYWPSM